jgi:hypothetical protein
MYPRGTRVRISSKWVGVVENVAKTSHGYVYKITLDDGDTVEAHESVVEEEGSRMKVGDKVRVKGHVPVDGGRSGSIVCPHACQNGAWWIEFDDNHNTEAFYGSDLELVMPNECDLSGKRVRITRGSETNKLGTVKRKNGDGWDVNLDDRHYMVFYYADELEVLPGEEGVNPNTWVAKTSSGMQDAHKLEVVTQHSIKKGDRVKVLVTSKKWDVGIVQSVAEHPVQGLKYKVVTDSGKTVWRYADSVKRLIDEPIELPLSEVIAAAEGDMAPAKDPVVFTCEMWLAILRD